MKNDYLDFYGKNKISPVNQDITDIEVHYKRRQKLYRQCGLPTVAFKGAQMLEVGPGGGHNALAPIHWGVEHIDLVEPNLTGVERIRELFSQRGISEYKYSIINEQIENYRSDKKYDIVVAEGFLGYVPNARDICKKLITLTNDGGVIAITCSDDICIFIELMKRLIGLYLTKDIKALDDKVRFLIPIFEKQLAALRGVSRPAKDWIEDNIFNPAFSNGCEYSVGDALDTFDGCDLLGGSPNIFTNYSWYKDIWYDELSDYKEQFNTKRMSFIMAGLNENKLDASESARLVEFFSKIKSLENTYEQEYDETILREIVENLKEHRPEMNVLGNDFCLVYDEIINALDEVLSGERVDMSKYPDFFKAFGRGLQYLAFMKK